MKRLIVIAFILTSCAAPKQGFIVRRNVVIPDRTVPAAERITEEDIESLIRLSPTPRLRFGTPYAMLDSALLLRSARNIETYLRSRGYYGSSLEWGVETRNNNARVTYRITQGQPFKIASVRYSIPDMLPVDTLGTELKTGLIFDIETLDAERRRITANLRNRGYYKFAVSNIEFIADTTRIQNGADLSVLVRETTPPYTLDSIAISPVKLRPEVLNRAIALRTGKPYSAADVDETYLRLMRLGYLRSVSILFDERPDTSLVAKITVSPTALQAIRTDLEGSFSSNFSAIGATIGYQNRNLFRGAELLDISLTGRYEFLRSVSNRGSYEMGAGVSLSWVNTRIETSLNFQDRPIYRRMLYSMRLGRTWNRGKSTLTYRPIDLNIIDVRSIDQAFLDNLKNPYLRSSYLSQLVPGTSFSWTMKSRPTVRFGVETAGNLFSLFSGAIDQTFSRYVRAEASIANTIPTGLRTNFAWRFLIGGATSYGHSGTNPTPIDRLFYSGGSNSMRGWVVRRLGPGTLPNDDKSYPSQVGNLKMEANVEFRFPVWDIVNSAVFLDAGNIWFAGRRDYEEADMNDAAMFRFRDFYRQLGLNTGLGLRLDFRRFLLRIDWGIRLHDPGLPSGRRWIRDFRLKNTALNFGVGYPF